MSASTGIRSIAFYLPQYHRIPENDQWWGEGFTDWTNVKSASPLFPGHYQPHVPADLGYYDLARPETREAQAGLARRYGIDAFCYYHYWFHGRRLLERPFDEVLRSGRPELPFCLCWANQSWTRAWDGNSRDVLMQQRYSTDDDRRHMDWLLQAFFDPRYLRIDGRPLFLVYSASSLPDPLRTTERWREQARGAGLEDLFLARVESSGELGDPRRLGFDAAVQFVPTNRGGLSRRLAVRAELLRRLGVRSPTRAGTIVAYDKLVRDLMGQADPPYPRFPCVVPSWDNTARRPWAPFIMQDSTPSTFGQWVAKVAEQLGSRPAEERLLFVNAWNEWAEGCHLEPCARWEHGYLEALADNVGFRQQRMPGEQPL